jgi:hypothetical protein
MIVALTYTLFVYFRCLLTEIDADKGNGEKMYMRLMAAQMSLALVVHANVIIHRKLIPLYVNHCHELALLFERKYLKSRARVPLIVTLTGWTLQAAYTTCIYFTILMTVNALMRPTSPEQPASVFASKPTIPIRIGSACFMCYIDCLYLSSVFPICAGYFPACSLFLSILSEMSYRTCCNAKEILRKSTIVKFQLYQLLRMEIKLLNTIFDFAILGLKIIGILVVVYGAYGGIRMEGIESAALGVLSPLMTVFILVIFSYLAEFHFRSTNLLREWKAQLVRDQNRRWVKKYIRALTPLKITIRSCYFVDRQIVLTLASILATNVSNILMLDH